MNKAILMIKRARKFNETVDPILKKLPKRRKTPAIYFLLGYVANHIPGFFKCKVCEYYEQQKEGRPC